MATLGTKRIFVTVGTTGFDELVAQVLSPTVLIQLAGLDFGEVMIQYGASRATFESYQPIGRIAVTGYAYKADVIEDMRAADLVISHGGSGSILECLSIPRPLIAVVNESLMDNHQQELVTALAQKGHLVKSACSALAMTLQHGDYAHLTPLPSPETHAFGSLLDEELDRAVGGF